MLQCKYCYRVTREDFNGIHICPKMKADETTGYSMADPIQIVPQLGCRLKTNKFYCIPQLLANNEDKHCFNTCKECITDLAKVRLLSQEWIYSIDPSLHHWFIELLKSYPYGWYYTSFKLDLTREKDPYYTCDLFLTMGKRDKFGEPERMVIKCIREAGIENTASDCLDSLVLRSVEFIQAVCQELKLDLNDWDLTRMFSLACLNGNAETARWLASTYLDKITFQAIALGEGDDMCDMAPPILRECEVEIFSPADLFKYILKCKLGQDKKIKVLDVIKEYFPSAFPKLEICNNTISSTDCQIKMVAVNTDEEDGITLRVLISHGLIGYWDPELNVPRGGWNLVSKAYDFIYDKMPEANLPEDMKTEMAFPWPGTEFKIFYGNKKDPTCGDYLVVVRDKTPVFVYHNIHRAFQVGDAGVDVLVSGNHMIIDNWGDVASQILLSYVPPTRFR